MRKACCGPAGSLNRFEDSITSAFEYSFLIFLLVELGRERKRQKEPAEMSGSETTPAVEADNVD